MSRKPIIADVARLAGVSTATVDRVLNDRGGVKPDKAAQVLSAARRLRLDRMLTRRFSRNQRIAVLFQSPDNPFHASLRDAFASASRAYADLNLQFLIHHIDFDDPRGIAAKIRSLGPRHDGLIVTSPDDPRIAAATREVSRAIPVIALATDIPDSNRSAYVGPDDRQAGRVAGDLVGRFLGRDGGDIVIISGMASVLGQRAREAGFRQVLGEHYPACRVERVQESREDPARAGLLMVEALKRNPAIRGVYHVTAGAAEVVAALRALGREDVVLVVHELTEERRQLLRDRAIAAIIDQNPEFEVRAAVEVMARLLGRMEGAAATTVTPMIIYTPENA